MFKAGDRVNEREYGAGTIVRIDEDDPYVPYYVRYDSKDYELWAGANDLTLLSAAVTLTPEKAAEVREALVALGWDRDDLGPLAEPEKPKRYGKADVAFPADDNYDQALEALEETARQWGGTITF